MRKTVALPSMDSSNLSSLCPPSQGRDGHDSIVALGISICLHRPRVRFCQERKKDGIVANNAMHSIIFDFR